MLGTEQDTYTDPVPSPSLTEQHRSGVGPVGAEGWEEGCEILTSGHGLAVALRDSR